MLHDEFIMHRHPGNPIIKPSDFPGAESVFNCGQVMMGDETVLLVAVLHKSGYYRGIPGATTHVARSRDGLHFEIDETPFLQRDTEGFLAEVDLHPIDSRVTKIGDTYYIVHPASGQWGTFGLLGKTKDFVTHEFIDVISLPDNRVPCLFPEKIGGKYWRLDRPYRVVPDEHHYFGHIWTACSPDLVHWGSFRPLMRGGFSPWAGSKIGPTPPVRTDAGWLVIIHGVAQNCSGYRYCLGAMLLDLEDPTKILGYTRSPILAPYALYEQTGLTPNVVFACGCIPDYDTRRIRIYYGAADTCIGLAEGSLDELIDACLSLA